MDKATPDSIREIDQAYEHACKTGKMTISTFDNKEVSKPINEFEKVHRNLWKAGGSYYRLFAIGITPNGCWLINPKMRLLQDIDIASSNDIYGASIAIDNITGTVSASHEFVRSTTDES